MKLNLLSSNEYIDGSGANKPILFTEMDPVIWNGTEFVKVNKTEKWYDYDTKWWANARTKDGSYWVWIPRYAYKITSGYNSSTTGTINIKFLKGTSNTTKDRTKIETNDYEVGVKDTSNNYFLHPAFEFDSGETGFWVAKYEPTAAEGVTTITGTCLGDNVTTKTVKIIPNATSWRCISVSNSYNVLLNMKNKTDVYGWLSIEVDTHMMKNMEWGAVAYLSKSKYGADTEEVWNNSYNQYKTGCSGSGVDAKDEGQCVAYNTENGQKASTTHNIYGVYDMSGGAWERVMGNYNNLHSGSGFTTQELSNIEAKYIDRYTTPIEELLNGVSMNYDNTIYGDGIFETSNDAYRYNGSVWSGKGTGSWDVNQSYQPKTVDPFFIRGGYWGDDSFAGLFAFNVTYELNYIHNSFRPVVMSK